MTSIDFNADLGETTAGNPVADDAAMMELITSANVACGFHAGDPHDISKTLKNAAAAGITVGAHVGYRDSAGFGRRFMEYAPNELADEVLYQIGALDALARAHGTTIRYVKPHGALYNTIVHHEIQAQAVIDGITAFSPRIAVMLLPVGVAIEKAEAAGLRVIREAFADRAYNPDGTLVSRREPNAVLNSVKAVIEQARQIAQSGSITATDGSTIQVNAESICVHGDSPGAVQMSRAVREQLVAEGIVFRSVL